MKENVKAITATLFFTLALFAGSSNAFAMPAGSTGVVELITNGGFEDGLNGWSCTGANFCSTSPAAAHTGDSGAYGWDNTGYATLSQTIWTTVGASYDFSFFSNSYQLAGNILGYSFSDYSNAVFVPTTTSWAQTVDSFIASSSSTNIQFYFSTVSGSGQWRIDDVSVQGSVISPVPEPETYAMLLFGLVFLGFTAHRRRDNTA